MYNTESNYAIISTNKSEYYGVKEEEYAWSVRELSAS